jgi:hypothetical protein
MSCKLGDLGEGERREAVLTFKAGTPAQAANVAKPSLALPPTDHRQIDGGF